MALARITGGLAVLCVVALVVGSLPALAELAAGDELIAAAGSLAVVAVLVGGTTLVGRRSDRWTDNPYW